MEGGDQRAETGTAVDDGRPAEDAPEGSAGVATIWWWRVRVLAGLGVVFLLPPAVIRWLPPPDQMMTVSLGPDGRGFVHLRIQNVPGFWPWMIVVGGTLALTGAVGWWVGRHSIRAERWEPRWAVVRDVLLGFVALGAGGFMAFPQFLDLLSDYAVTMECELPRCTFPSSVQFPSAVDYLRPWAAAFPLAAGFLTRAVLVGRRRTVAPLVSRSQRIWVLVVLVVAALASAWFMLPFALLLLRRV